MKFIRIISISFITLIFIFSFSGSGTEVHADSNGLRFMVEPILPENQDKDVGSYISVSPNENTFSQELKFKISNESNVEQEVRVSIVDAYTSPNGVIQYVAKESENTEIINEKYKLSNYFDMKDDLIIKLEKGETRIFSTVVDIDDLEGVLLGGVRFNSLEDEIINEEKDKGFTLKNKINMIIGVMINFDTEKDIEFIIDEPFLDPMPSYYSIRLPITLNTPLLVQNTIINYQVIYKSEELFNDERELSFSPYAKTNVSIPFEYDEINQNEDYTIKGELIYKDHEGHEVTKNFEETFQYKKEKVKSGTDINTLMKPIENSQFPTGIILLVLIPVFLITFLVYKNRKKEVSLK